MLRDGMFLTVRRRFAVRWRRNSGRPRRSPSCWLPWKPLASPPPSRRPYGMFLLLFTIWEPPGRAEVTLIHPSTPTRQDRVANTFGSRNAACASLSVPPPSCCQWAGDSLGALTALRRPAACWAAKARSCTRPSSSTICASCCREPPPGAAERQLPRKVRRFEFASLVCFCADVELQTAS